MERSSFPLWAFFGSVWTHWDARFGTTFAVALATIQYMFLEFQDASKISHWVRGFPPSLWLAAAAVLLFWSCYGAWHDELKKRIEAERNLEEAVNKDRPDVFALLNFGPNPYRHSEMDARDSAFVRVLNKGRTFAKNVRIDPVEIDGRLLTFKELQFVNPQQSIEPDFEWAGINWEPKKWDALIDILRRVAEKRGKAGNPERLQFQLKVFWEDSSDRRFSSSSEIQYIRSEERCRSHPGAVTYLRSTPL